MKLTQLTKSNINNDDKHVYFTEIKDQVLCAEIHVRLHLLLLFSITDLYIPVYTKVLRTRGTRILEKSTLMLY